MQQPIPFSPEDCKPQLLKVWSLQLLSSSCSKTRIRWLSLGKKKPPKKSPKGKMDRRDGGASNLIVPLDFDSKHNAPHTPSLGEWWIGPQSEKENKNNTP